MMVTPSHRFLVLYALAAVACSDGAQIIGEPDPSGGAGASAAGATGEAPENETPEPSAPPVDPAKESEEPGEPGDPDMPSASETDGKTPIQPPGEPVPEFVVPRGACALGQRVGRFTIEKQVEFGVVQGLVNEGVVPTAIPRLALEEGTCRLLERRTLSCIPGCVGAETCGEGGSCIPYPRQISSGEVVVTGLTKETRMSPLVPGNTYFAPGADNPPFAVGSQVVLSAAGDGGVAPFQLFGRGSEPLAEAPAWVLEAGTALVLSWAAPTADVGTSMLVELTIDQHGVSPLSLSCEFPDTGSATVPASVIDELIGAGISGFPNGRLTRRTIDHVELGFGCVELAVGSPLGANISVPGYTPCYGTADCPDGQACNIALERCE